MALSLWFTFFVACIVFSVAPGAGTVASISNSLNVGFKTAVKGIVGLQLALISHLLIVSFGLGALLASSATAFTAIKYLGAAYLIYVGVSKILAAKKSKIGTDAGDVNPKALIRQCYIVNIMNPKSIIFLAAFLPQFIDPQQAMIGQYLILGTTVVLVDTCVMLGYTIMASVAKPYLTSPSTMKAMNRVFGSLFVSMGVLLARAEQ
ncbi:MULTISPECIES: homoserine/homoserine lactone efflux protein [Photobacterium]|uniref:Homoserine lactone transporter n=1 Tax=Photobacterium halotolerans TaxID=265726 RepID=A0A0F5VBW1_9GAMM|nr:MULTISPECIES: homoserine/homoserine lactone efflux protein [Photobacterium]KKC99598.1 homoserine lactone transporter [Photobacterium halotolerans]UIP29884.1 homoserine/homoserine lactone efflux protein [Photobacterium sp. TLY01]